MSSAAASNAAEILRVVQEDRPEAVILSDHLEDGPVPRIRILPEILRIDAATRILVVMEALDSGVSHRGFQVRS